MSIVGAACPNCGASIQLDNERQDGFCSYCGSKIKVQEAISLIKLDKGDELENYLHLAENALNGQNADETYLYASKALEINTKNVKAWLYKMYALDSLGTLEDLRVDEIINCGYQAIELSNDDKIQNDVYWFFLNKAVAILNLCHQLISDTQEIQSVYNSNLFITRSSINPFSKEHIQATYNYDAPFVDMIDTNVTVFMVNLKCAVPVDVINNNTDYIACVNQIANGFISYTESLKQRCNIYGSYFPDSAIEARKNILLILKEGLPQEQAQKVSEEQIHNKTTSSGGCYIATAVYGSYEADEVLVLRQYRDLILSKTFLGKLFIKVYYYFSPSIANKLKADSFVNHFIKKLLDKWVSHLRIRFNEIKIN
ncbi:MAG: zinc ribbon domain-containing protein [Tannerellaceae bacterium]|jgi:DNA-directed RNA polymerase subunit RPC12/RpoP|nr:zinc ribbon domain-containing protein [Tannerellaceae bacterium]